MPASVDDLGIRHPIGARRAYQAHMSVQRKFFYSINHPSSGLYKFVGLLNNLDTIEYVHGFRNRNTPASTEEILRLLGSAGPISRTHMDLTTELWKHKKTFWGNPRYPMRDHSAMLVKAVLENKFRKGPLRLIIRGIDEGTLLWWIKQWPENNSLHSVEIEYSRRKMSDDEESYYDLGTLCHQGQFSNLRNMSWAGQSLHHKGSFNLKYLGRDTFTPAWPFLSTLELYNVKLGSACVQYLKDLRVHARFKNIIWLENAITGFEKGSSLRQAICSGIQVVHYALVTYRCFGPASGIAPIHVYKHGDIPSKVFVVAYDVEGAMKLACENAKYCSPVPRQDGDAIPFVLPDEMSQYMIHGGYCAIDGIEDGGAVWAEDWQM